MNGTNTIPNRGFPPKIPKIITSQNYKKLKRKHSNERVNYTSNDLKIIETYGDLNSSEIISNNRIKRKESNERKNGTNNSLKRSDSKPVQIDTESQYSDKNSNKCRNDNNSSWRLLTQIQI